MGARSSMAASHLPMRIVWWLALGVLGGEPGMAPSIQPGVMSPMKLNLVSIDEGHPLYNLASSALRLKHATCLDTACL